MSVTITNKDGKMTVTKSDSNGIPDEFTFGTPIKTTLSACIDLGNKAIIHSISRKEAEEIYGEVERDDDNK